MSAVKGASCFALHHMNIDILKLKHTLHYSKLAKIQVIFPLRYRGLHHPFSQGTKKPIQTMLQKKGFVWTIAEQSLSFGSWSEKD